MYHCLFSGIAHQITCSRPVRIQREGGGGSKSSDMHEEEGGERTDLVKAPCEEVGITVTVLNKRVVSGLDYKQQH